MSTQTANLKLSLYEETDIADLTAGYNTSMGILDSTINDLQAKGYSLPIASTSTLGGIKPDGSTITVDAVTGVASVPYPTSMTVYANGTAKAA